VGNHFHFKGLSVLALMQPKGVLFAFSSCLQQVRGGVFTLRQRTYLKDTHAFEFIPRVAVLANGRLVDTQKAQGLHVVEPRGKRTVFEQKTEHGLVFAQFLFGAAAFDSQGDVAADGVEELQVAQVVSVFVLVVLHHQDADGGGGRFQWNSEPSGRRRAHELNFAKRRQSVEIRLRD
jgi:hypothetical protein